MRLCGRQPALGCVNVVVVVDDDDDIVTLLLLLLLLLLLFSVLQLKQEVSVLSRQKFILSLDSELINPEYFAMEKAQLQ